MTDTQPRSDFSEYAQTIWGIFCSIRSSEFPLISPAEFALLRKWYDLGIPVRYVAMGMRLTKGKGRGLAYYEPAIFEEAKRASRALSL